MAGGWLDDLSKLAQLMGTVGGPLLMTGNRRDQRVGALLGGLGGAGELEQQWSEANRNKQAFQDLLSPYAGPTSNGLSVTGGGKSTQSGAGGTPDQQQYAKFLLGAQAAGVPIKDLVGSTAMSALLPQPPDKDKKTWWQDPATKKWNYSIPPATGGLPQGVAEAQIKADAAKAGKVPVVHAEKYADPVTHTNRERFVTYDSAKGGMARVPNVGGSEDPRAPYTATESRETDAIAASKNVGINALNLIESLPPAPKGVGGAVSNRWKWIKYKTGISDENPDEGTRTDLMTQLAATKQQLMGMAMAAAGTRSAQFVSKFEDHFPKPTDNDKETIRKLHDLFDPGGIVDDFQRSIDEPASAPAIKSNVKGGAAPSSAKIAATPPPPPFAVKTWGKLPDGRYAAQSSDGKSYFIFDASKGQWLPF